MRRALIYLHISIFLWGFTGIFGRAIELKELVLVWYRLIFTVALLLLIPAFSRNIKRLSFKEAKRIIFVGFLVAIHWVLFYGSIKYSNISIGLSCLSTIAVFTALLDPLINHKKINIRELLLSIFAFLGMIVIFRVQELHRTGIILGIGAALAGSYFTILNAKLVQDFPSETVTFYELASGLILITLMLPFYQYLFPSSTLIPTKVDLILLFFFSIFCTVIPFNLSLKALQYVSAFTSNLYINLEPIYGIAFAVLFFQEEKELKPGFYLGSAIILSSVVIYTIIKYQTPKINAASKTKQVNSIKK